MRCPPYNGPDYVIRVWVKCLCIKIIPVTLCVPTHLLWTAKLFVSKQHEKILFFSCCLHFDMRKCLFACPFKLNAKARPHTIKYVNLTLRSRQSIYKTVKIRLDVLMTATMIRPLDSWTHSLQKGTSMKNLKKWICRLLFLFSIPHERPANGGDHISVKRNGILYRTTSDFI